MQMHWRRVHVSARFRGPVEQMLFQEMLLALLQRSPGKSSLDCVISEREEPGLQFIIAEFEFDSTLPIEEIRTELARTRTEIFEVFCPNETIESRKQSNDTGGTSTNNSAE